MRAALATDPVAAGPGGPPGLPLVGHAPLFLRDKLGFLRRCAERYGDVVELDIGGPTYLLTHPDDIGHVLRVRHERYEKSPRVIGPRGKRVFGDGVISASSEDHAAKRAAVQPAFRSDTVAAVAEVTAEVAERTVAGWKTGSTIDAASGMMALVQEVTIRTLLGVEDEPEVARLAWAITARRRYLEHLFRSPFPFPERLPVRVNRTYHKAARVLGDTIHRRIQEVREAPDSSILSVLAHASVEAGAPLTDDQIRDEALTFALAGYETLGESLAWTWYLLAQHPEAEQRVAEESRALPPERRPGMGDLSALGYTEMVWSEAMRLYPPTWLFVRVATEADALPSGPVLPAGAKVYLSQYVTQRTARYFPDPDAFDPLRFSREAKRGRPRYAYFPFGGGPRTCVAMALARVQALLVVATVARRHRLALVPGQEVAPEPDMTLRPKGGVLMTVAPR